MMHQKVALNNVLLSLQPPKPGGVHLWKPFTLKCVRVPHAAMEQKFCEGFQIPEVPAHIHGSNGGILNPSNGKHDHSSGLPAIMIEVSVTLVHASLCSLHKSTSQPFSDHQERRKQQILSTLRNVVIALLHSETFATCFFFLSNCAG
jgi:hypothetical protein